MPDGPAIVSPDGRPPDRAGLSFVDRLRARYDRILSNPAFQRWASSFPLTRPIARRHARALFDLCAGFVYSQVLLAFVRLRLFEILADGPQTLVELAERTRLPPASALRLLDAAVSLGLAAKRGNDRYGLGAHGAALQASPGVVAMVEHHALVYRDLADPVALLRGAAPESGLRRYWPYSGSDRPETLSDDSIAAYSRLMSESQPLVADTILDAYPLDRHRCLLDLGGGDGTFLSIVARRAPNLRLMLFDLPAVAARAAVRFAESGLGARASAHGGDFRRDSLPAGADVVSLVRVLHDHDDGSALEILRAARGALRSGGTLLIGEPMADAPGAATVGAAYFGFYLLAMGQGRARTPAEIGDLLFAAGFCEHKTLKTNIPLQAGVIVATADGNM
jgi:demethylspheroidene O-methyltransferase